MITLQDSVGMVPGIGEVVQGHLQRLGIVTLGDLAQWYPRDYLDASHPTPIAKLPYNRLVAVQVAVKTVNVRRSKARNIPMVEVVVSDESGDMTVRWFNQPFLKQKLKPDSQWILIGVASRFRGETVMVSPLIEETPHILSIYAQTHGVTSKMLRGYLDWLLHNVSLERNGVPASVREREGLPSFLDLLKGIHQPVSLDEITPSRQGLAFEEAFWFFVRMAVARAESTQQPGITLKFDVEWLKRVVASLPFELTPGQKRAIWDILQDMQTGRVMTRLVNGDVGSGKTAVAAIVAAVMAQAGYQTVFLAPTEILAKQHLESVGKLLAVAGCKVVLWTGAQKDSLENVDIVVGTHAVLGEKFSLPRIGLVVVDEQHRFGVRQRQLLRNQKGASPHLLSMTATPIPRTLALALYGDLTVSVLPDKPKNRLPVITRIVGSTGRQEMYAFIKSEIDQGRQVFVLCPLITETETKSEAVEENGQFKLLTPQEEETQSKKTVLAEVEKLRAERPEFGVIEALHGKLKTDQKREIMGRMAAGEINVLVATSVIEVGVDVPNASVMVIENAEHFGLAQLHQLRGRVGRSDIQSYCFLCPGNASSGAINRLRVLTQTESGFEIAEADLKQRGPGELIGQVQSGLPDFRMASLTDLDLLHHVKSVVDAYCKENPSFLHDYAEVAYSKETRGLE